MTTKYCEAINLDESECRRLAEWKVQYEVDDTPTLQCDYHYRQGPEIEWSESLDQKVKVKRWNA